MNKVKVVIFYLLLIVAASVILCSCKKKKKEAAPVINTYTVKYQVRYVGEPTSTPFTINYYQGGENHTTFVAIGSGEMVKYWNVSFTAQTGDYVYLKCTPPMPPVGYSTLCTVSIEATPSSPAIYLEKTASYPGFAEVSDTLP